MNYQTLISQSEELLRSEPWYVAALSNLSALIMSSLPDLNWAGFYLMKDGALVVGPFQGNPACIHIPVGKGVCGTAVQKDETILVPDVHQFPGHIACDNASQSEIVIPIHRNGNIVAVLDIDSPLKNRFTDEDRQGLEAVVKKIESLTVFRISRD